MFDGPFRNGAWSLAGSRGASCTRHLPTYTYCLHQLHVLRNVVRAAGIRWQRSGCSQLTLLRCTCPPGAHLEKVVERFASWRRRKGLAPSMPPPPPGPAASCNQASRATAATLQEYSQTGVCAPPMPSACVRSKCGKSARCHCRRGGVRPAEGSAHGCGEERELLYGTAGVLAWGPLCRISDVWSEDGRGTAPNKNGDDDRPLIDAHFFCV